MRVRSWVSTNSGLKFNPIFQFLRFYISVYFTETLQTKTTIDRDKISKEISRNAIHKLLESLERGFNRLLAPGVIAFYEKITFKWIALSNRPQFCGNDTQIKNNSGIGGPEIGGF